MSANDTSIIHSCMSSEPGKKYVTQNDRCAAAIDELNVIRRIMRWPIRSSASNSHEPYINIYLYLVIYSTERNQALCASTPNNFSSLAYAALAPDRRSVVMWLCVNLTTASVPSGQLHVWCVFVNAMIRENASVTTTTTNKQSIFQSRFSKLNIETENLAFSIQRIVCYRLCGGSYMTTFTG